MRVDTKVLDCKTSILYLDISGKTVKINILRYRGMVINEIGAGHCDVYGRVKSLNRYDESFILTFILTFKYLGF